MQPSEINEMKIFELPRSIKIAEYYFDFQTFSFRKEKVLLGGIFEIFQNIFEAICLGNKGLRTKSKFRDIA